MKSHLSAFMVILALVSISTVTAPPAASSQPFLSLHLDTEGTQAFCPYPFIPFNAYLVLHNADYYVTAVEYKLGVQDGSFIVLDYSFPPEHSVDFGHPLNGQSISYWPPLNGFGGDLVLCTMECMTLTACPDMPDYPIVIAPHPDSGYLRGTYSPDNEFFDIIGGSSYLCHYSSPPFLMLAIALTESNIRASFLNSVDNWAEEYPGGSYVMDNTEPGDTIHVIDAIPDNSYNNVFILTLDTPLTSGHDYTLYVTNACTDGACMNCVMDTRFDFYYEAPIGTESSSWGRIKTSLILLPS